MKTPKFKMTGKGEVEGPPPPDMQWLVEQIRRYEAKEKHGGLTNHEQGIMHALRYLFWELGRL